MSMMVPIEMAAVVVLACVGIAVFLQFRYTRDCCEEGKIFNKASKDGIPVLSVENIANGNAKFVLGTKDEAEDPMFEIEGVSMKIDPSICSGDAAPTRYKKGLNIWHYASAKSLPLSTSSALAYKTMSAHRNDKKIFKSLSALTDPELFALLRQPREDLYEAVRVLHEKYSPTEADIDDLNADQPMSLDEMVLIIEEIQKHMALLPVETGLFCYHKAFKDLPYAHSSQDIERIKYLIEQKLWQFFNNREKMWTYILMALALIGGICIGIYVLSMAFGG